MSSYAKQKGKLGERKLADIITAISGVKYRRTPNSGAMRGVFNHDLMKEDARKDSMFDGIGIECKNTKDIAMPSWIEQSESAIADAGIVYNPKWFIAFRHKAKWYFCLNENYFRKLCTYNQLQKEE